MQDFIYQIVYQNYHLAGALAPTFVEILLSFLAPLLAVFGSLESPFGPGLIRRIAESFIISTRPCWCPCQVVLRVRGFIPFSFGDFSIVFCPPPLIRRPCLHKQGDPVRSALWRDQFPARLERERVVPQCMAEVERYDLWWIISGKTPLVFPPHESRPRAIDCPLAFSCKSAASGGRTVRWRLNRACRV